jgi:competence protein ComEA
MRPTEARQLADATPSLQPAQRSAHHEPSPLGSARFRGLVAKMRSSPWLPVAARGAAIVGFMLGFAAVGAASSWIQPPGVHVASQMSASEPILWLAPTPEAGASQVTKPKAPALAPTPNVPAEPEAHSVRVAASCHAEGGLCDGQPKQHPPEGVTSDGKVILNVASAEVLTRLPGVGPRRATSIVELRERLKGFRRTSDLLRVRGIGVKSLKRMLPHLVLDAPAAEGTKSPEEPLAL